MHELSLCIALMQQLERVAQEQQAGSVIRVVLRLGPLSGVEAPLLKHAWPLASVGTLAEAAELEIEATAVTVACTECHAVSEATPNRLLCAKCGDFRTRLVSGDELLLASVELSDFKEQVA